MQDDRNKRFVELSDTAKARILDPALEQFVEKGFERASLNTILEHAKMSKGQAYYYFKDKADLFFRVCERELLPLSQLIAFDPSRRVEDVDFWRWVQETMETVTNYFLEHPKAAALGHVAYESRASNGAYLKLLDVAEFEFNAIVSHGRKVGAIRSDLPDELLSSVLLSVTFELDRWSAANLKRLNNDEREKLKIASINMLKNMVK